MKQLYAILWRDLNYFKKRFISISISSLISPTLYILAFGLGLGRFVHIENTDYLSFLIPGILAINTMNVSFNSIATPLTIARIHDKTLEEYLLSPTGNFTFTLGKILAGALRGIYSAVLIIILAKLFLVNINITPLFILLLFLNCLVFSSLGFFISMIIKSHLDMARFRNFLITPMVFICGTFFSLEGINNKIGFFLKILPLTPASYGLRYIALNNKFIYYYPLIQLIYLSIFFFLGYYFYKRI